MACAKTGAIKCTKYTNTLVLVALSASLAIGCGENAKSDSDTGLDTTDMDGGADDDDGDDGGDVEDPEEPVEELVLVDDLLHHAGRSRSRPGPWPAV